MLGRCRAALSVYTDPYFMLESLEYGLVVPLRAAWAACRAALRAFFPDALPLRFTGALAGCGAWACATLRWRCRSSPSKARKEILRGVFTLSGLAACGVLPDDALHGENTRDWMRTEGMEHYLAAQARGKGVLVLTGHLGAWELSSFYHSLMGHPMGMLIRRLDNRRLDEYVNRIRCLHGNFVFSQGRLRARAADGDSRGRDGGHADRHEHDAAAG